MPAITQGDFLSRGGNVQAISFLGGIFTLVWIFTEGGGPILLVMVLVVGAIFAAVAWGAARDPNLQAQLDEAEASLKGERPRRKSKAARKVARPKAKAPPAKPVKASPARAVSTMHTRLLAANVAGGSQQTISDALGNLPDFIRQQSGSLFYTGRDAFSQPSSIYVLGLNPGGDPVAQKANTIEKAIAAFETAPARWSAYQDDSWEGAEPGTWGMQPRVLHFFEGLGLDARLVPASNVIFVRSSTESTLAYDKNELIAACWPVHKAVISQLGVRAIVCFGGTAGKWVREQVGANNLIGEFRETNARGWKSQAHQNGDGFTVITLTHPGRADWRNPAADPTQFVKSILEQGSAA